ncbi:MAG: anhydro-N-acetylmuramic acid kinase [Bacteroidota bacterium]
MIDNYGIIGLMSGTSVDGLDMVYCELKHEREEWQFELRAAQTIDYDDALQLKLKKSTDLSALDLLKLNVDYGIWLGEKVNTFRQKFGIKTDYVASHGHTVHHRPENGITYQIGDGQQLANVTGLTVICNFRSKDVSLGGQGAPLVPVGDKYFFSEYNFCLNLGGISNISFDKDGKRLAYDIGLANMILDYLAAQIDLKYDEEGRVAKSGALNESLFRELNALSYYELSFPKSTGYEWFAESVIPLLKSSDISIVDKLCTAVHHVAYSVARDVKKFAGNGSEMLVTGGGAKNNFLVDCLKSYLAGSVSVHIPNIDIIEYKEAIVFGLLGVLRLRNEVNCLKSVTGAKYDSSGGVIYKPS